MAAGSGTSASSITTVTAPAGPDTAPFRTTNVGASSVIWPAGATGAGASITIGSASVNVAAAE